MLARSINLARSLRNFGTKPGDVLALHGKNHLDLHIPYYAALMNGMPVVGVDPMLKFGTFIRYRSVPKETKRIWSLSTGFHCPLSV